MPTSQLPSYWEEANFKASLEDPAQECLPVYSESINAQVAPTSSEQSSRLTVSKIKSAIWSFIKGKPYLRHIQAPPRIHAREIRQRDDGSAKEDWSIPTTKNDGRKRIKLGTAEAFSRNRPTSINAIIRVGIDFKMGS
ncbi:uncharacterized protein N7496_012760 [Penicillium cataractarum]|uniref:Uncharacterized protein n=1 Tax=Penicillium cataractarum TaxID=2100454 RepID=A0A9W9R8N4_9EURO|nr:uncharacterized protein N7496_012760 [Penicillium cataractarum]KAJ5355548.1 hypothetical protein N7496_012760 [Penicillium cataractarum]